MAIANAKYLRRIQPPFLQDVSSNRSAPRSPRLYSRQDQLTSRPRACNPANPETDTAQTHPSALIPTSTAKDTHRHDIPPHTSCAMPPQSSARARQLQPICWPAPPGNTPTPMASDTADPSASPPPVGIHAKDP